MARYYSSGYKKSQKNSGGGNKFWVWSTIVLLILFGGTIFYFTRMKQPDNQNQNKTVLTNESVDAGESNNFGNLNALKNNSNKAVPNSNQNSNKNSAKSLAVKAHIALIIDDLGNQDPSAEPTKSLLSIKAPLTLSIIPERVKTADVAAAAKTAGFEVMIHQPMEPVDPSLSAGDGAILANMTDAQISQIIDKHISQIPQAVGMNNHMGSKVTQDLELMRSVMKGLKKKNFYFIDSMTISNSKGFAAAQEEGLKTAKRDVFIDGQDDEAYIRNQILSLANMALGKPAIVPIGIGHIRTKTVSVLKEMIPELASMGVGLKKISEMIK